MIEVLSSYPGRSAARSGALQTRDRHGLWRSRISGAPLRSAVKLARIACNYLRCFALRRIRDTLQQSGGAMVKTPVAAAFALVLASLHPVGAQEWPARTLTMVVPFPAGGPIDLTARLLTQRLAPILGQTVIIENRGGAGGALGTKAAAGADPDGYTLLFGNASALVVGPAVYRFRDYDTLKQFTPVAKVTEGYEVLVVAPNFPARNVAELTPPPRTAATPSRATPPAATPPRAPGVGGPPRPERGRSSPRRRQSPPPRRSS